MSQLRSRFLLLFFIILSPLFGNLVFQDKRNQEIRIAVAKSAQEIDLAKGKEILVASFMKEYEDVPLSELNPSFRSIGDVRRFYEDYFDSELEHFQKGHLVWLQAFINEELVGWATFERESETAAYMNLLVVDPKHQRKGIGKELVFSIRSSDLFPNIDTIHLLLRKVNLGGRNFYQNIGFFESDYQKPDNFVDNSLLTGFEWKDLCAKTQN